MKIITGGKRQIGKMVENKWREGMYLFFEKTFAKQLSLLEFRSQAFHIVFLVLSVFKPLLIYPCQPQLVQGREGKKGIWNCSGGVFAERLQKSRTELSWHLQMVKLYWWLPLRLAFGEKKLKRTQGTSKDGQEGFEFLNKSVLGREDRVVDACSFHFPHVLCVCNKACCSK